MTQQQLKNKIAELDFWLKHNGSHPQYATILADKTKLMNQLILLENGE
jgi:hypothetical protein